MKKESKIRIGLVVGVTVALVGAVIAWASSQDAIVGQHSDRLGRIELMQTVIIKDIDRIIVKQDRQDSKLDEILIEVTKRER